MITIMTLILFGSFILFIASLLVALRETSSNNKLYQYLISETLQSPNVQTSFDRAARRPARILGTFIL